MPNRILRDWTDSETIDELDVHTERFFTRLIMKVDDYGRYSTNLKLLRSTLYPLKTDIRETDITRWLAECEKSGLIALYHVTEKGYLQIENFKQTLRQKNEKYPAPEGATQMHSIRIADAHTKRNETNPKGNDVEVPTTTNFEYKKIMALTELFKRICNWDERTIAYEVGKFINKYPNIEPNKSGGLINTWVANHRAEVISINGAVKKMVL